MLLKRLKKVTLTLGLALAIMPLVFAAGGDEGAADGPIELPVLMRNAGNDSGTMINQFFVDNFNKEFEDYEYTVRASNCLEVRRVR